MLASRSVSLVEAITLVHKKKFVVVIWGNINVLYKVDMLITNMSAIFLHERFFMNDRNIYHFYPNSRDPGCIKFITAKIMSEI